MDSRGYQDAIKNLNSLISQQRRSDGKNWASAFEAVSVYVKRLGLEEDLAKLSIIHVAGTKGKGSTCCMVESMLRASGYTTGLYTSPHLVDVRERIRLGGAPIAQDKWLEHFWWTWDRLKETETEDLGMPAYFRFMTLLGLRTFVAEKVEVAILEVGLGGRLDATNVVPAPRVCGVSALGYDHVELLGHTLPEIAREKAGIFKPGVPAISTPQEDDAMAALQLRAKEVGIPLTSPAPLETYSLEGGSKDIPLGLAGAHQRVNAALAVALCAAWEQRDAAASGPASRTSSAHSPLLASGILPAPYAAGLAAARWPGRAQILRFGVGGEDLGEEGPGAGDDAPLSFYLDGAHTPESMATCAQWFADAAGSGAGGMSEGGAGGDGTRRILFFNTMQERDPNKLLGPLSAVLRERGVRLHHAVFAPQDSLHGSVDAKAADSGQALDVAWQRSLKSTWDRVYVPPAAAAGMPPPALPPAPPGAVDVTGPGAPVGGVAGAVAGSGGAVMPSLQVALEWLRACARQEPKVRVQVLVTGSLYLVGDVLRLLKRAPV